ncbi:MAG: hypothetical protein WCA10_10020 [Terracidiphilus sp.]
MMPFFNLTYPHSQGLLADNNKSQGERERIPCPITTKHWDGHRRISPLYLEVKHNRRDELMIWGAGLGIHEQILGEFKKEGFTGYRVAPASVRFRDGSISTEYQELIVTGWAGMASPESGLRLTMSCPACHYKEYSPITNYDKVIDWNQWTGDDFFVVHPIEWYKLCTERVAQWLLARKVKTFRLEEGFAERARDSLVSKFGFSSGRLTNYLPEDLAIKYGKPLGLE